VSEDAARGAGAAVAATAVMHGDSIAAMWRPVAGAADYRVRISAPDGTGLLEAATADSTIAFPLDAVAGRADTVYLSVLARDALRQPIAASALTPLVLVRR
jgi:hypothetical protein